MKKLFALGLFLLLLAASANALQVTKHEIEVKLDEDGKAHVIENYSLKFDNPFELEEFKETAQKNSTSLHSWKAGFDWFYMHFGSIDELKRSYVVFDEINKKLILDYFLNKAIATKIRETPRSIDWKIEDMQLQNFQKAGLIVIPEEVRIIFEPPPNSVIAKQFISNKATIQEDKVILSGISTNYLNLQYSILKPIASPDLFKWIQDFGSTNLFIVLVIIVLVIAGLYWKKEEIEKKIEDYILKHSEIEVKRPEEEIEVEV